MDVSNIEKNYNVQVMNSQQELLVSGPGVVTGQVISLVCKLQPNQYQNAILFNTNGNIKNVKCHFRSNNVVHFSSFNLQQIENVIRFITK
ncbi:hypothetical protein COM97_18670 [Bacillus thuringiensis]|uniref:hypothetical protein n=1 Tax=Bacillus thuringiensis TaxID=1428 RepID=UPI000BEC4DA6|nr:hypothetical protein [Bacillus thuringiensis]PEF04992.1 hypothetical protein COM97_18670 [Bacillus thuringiensis]